MPGNVEDTEERSEEPGRREATLGFSSLLLLCRHEPVVMMFQKLCVSK
jgi:hypothetical protein